MDPIFLLFAGVSALLFIVGDVLLKFWAERSNVWFMIIAFAVYIVAGFFTALSLKRKDLAIAIAVMLSINLIGVALIGFTVFKEALGLKEVIGISFALAAIIILNL